MPARATPGSEAGPSSAANSDAGPAGADQGRDMPVLSLKIDRIDGGAAVEFPGRSPWFEDDIVHWCCSCQVLIVFI